MEEPEPKLISAVTASNGLIFLSHIEERPDHPMDGLNGMEIYNRHYDAKKDTAGLMAIATKLLDPTQVAELLENLQLYPDELLAAQVTYQELYIKKWDAETRLRRLTGIAANDCHHNQIMVVKMVDEKTVLVGTNVDKDEAMRRVNADSHPSIRELTRGHKPGDILARADFDPYYRSFRNCTTHILAPELTEVAVRTALQQGHAYVSHDWMCDATGFAFVLNGNAEGIEPSYDQATMIMGDEAKFAEGLNVQARFPVSCHARLLLNGKVIKESECDQLEQSVSGPGTYRVEGWLKIDGEDRPWIYSNPIYLK